MKLSKTQMMNGTEQAEEIKAKIEELWDKCQNDEVCNSLTL